MTKVRTALIAQRFLCFEHDPILLSNLLAPILFIRLRKICYSCRVIF